MATPVVTGYQGQMLTTNPLVATGQKNSVAMELKGLVPVGILFRGLTSTAMTFLACDTLGGTYVPVKSLITGTALSYTVAADEFLAIDPAPFQGVQFLKLAFGTNEASDRTPVVSLKGI